MVERTAGDRRGAEAMMYRRYIWYVLRHKWFVFLEAYNLGITWLGLVHDLSKFRLGEMLPYAQYFYGRKPQSRRDDSFDYAWLLHQKRNKHHWQWWVLPEDDGGLRVLEMPDRYRKEMLADWHGAGRALGNPNTAGWYEANKNKMWLGKLTRQWVESEIMERKG